MKQIRPAGFDQPVAYTLKKGGVRPLMSAYRGDTVEEVADSFGLDGGGDKEMWAGCW